MKFRDYKIEKDYKHIYYFLKENGFSETYISSLRSKKGYILVNDNPSTTRSPLKLGDILKLCLDTKQKTQILKNSIQLNIVFEDDFYLIVNKPHRLSTSPSKSHYTENLAGAILNYMQKKDPNFVLRILNRLDYDTAGLIIVAKDVESYSKICNIEKKYFAICNGIINKEILIDEPILTIIENGINQQKRVVDLMGKAAQTHVIPVQKFDNKTLISLKLKHGRTHQIRVHLAHINHPLLGDKIYNSEKSNLSHTALICKEIFFLHPFTNKEIFLEIPFSKVFEEILTK